MVLAVTLPLSLGACSDDDGDRLTAEELRTEATGICAELAEDAGAAFADLQPDDEPTAYQGAIEKLLPVVDGAIEDLDGLEPPADLEARYEEGLAALRSGRAAVAEAGKTPEGSASVFAGRTGPFDEANAVFSELGISCGGGGQSGGGTGGRTGEGTTGEGTTGEGG